MDYEFLIMNHSSNHNYELWIMNYELTEDCELIKGYELKKAPEVMNTSEAKSVYATMSG